MTGRPDLPAPPPGPPPAAGPLVLGPGPRPAQLGRLLAERGVELRALDAPGSLGGPRGRLVLDGDLLGGSEVRSLLGLLDARPGWRLLVVASGPRREHEPLEAHARVRVLEWPLEPDALEWLALGQLPPSPGEGLDASRASTVPDPPAPGAEPAELEAIEAVLAGRPVAGLGRPGSAAVPRRAPSAGAGVPVPDHLLDQARELEDIASALELGILDVGDRAPAALLRDLERLRRSARTLADLARPPALVRATVDLHDLVAERLEARSDRARREVLLRGAGPLPVEADVPRLGELLESLLELAEACAGPGEVLRLALEPSGSRARLTLEFPLGPLLEAGVQDPTRPHALRPVLPELAPGDLASAASVAVAHGGRLRFEPGARTDTRRAVLELPLAGDSRPRPGDAAPPASS